VQIQAQISWQVVRDPRDGHVFGVCPALNLNAAGDSMGEFQEAAEETVGLLFQSLFKHGELESFLSRHGWRSATRLPPPGARVRFAVPRPFAIEPKERFQDLVTA